MAQGWTQLGAFVAVYFALLCLMIKLIERI